MPSAPTDTTADSSDHVSGRDRSKCNKKGDVPLLVSGIPYTYLHIEFSSYHFQRVHKEIEESHSSCEERRVKLKYPNGHVRKWLAALISWIDGFCILVSVNFGSS